MGPAAAGGQSVQVEGDVAGANIIQSGGDISLALVPTPDELSSMLASVSVEGKEDTVLVGYNEKGAPIWRLPFETRITKAILDDLDNDETPEVLVGFRQPGPLAGWFQVYAEDGKKIAEYNAWEPSIYAGGNKQAVNVIDFAVEDLTGDGRPRIVAITNDTYWYASGVSILEYNAAVLNQVSRYWNPGLLYTLDLADLDQDGVQEVVVTGANNDLKWTGSVTGNAHIVMMLHGDDVRGQAPPGLGSETDGSQVWYAYAVPSGARFVQVEFEDFDGDGQLEVHAGLDDACSFYISLSGDIMGRGYGTVCQRDSEVVVLR